MASRTKWVADALQRYQRVFAFSFSAEVDPDVYSDTFLQPVRLDDPGGIVESIRLYPNFYYYTDSFFRIVLSDGFVSLPGISPTLLVDDIVNYPGNYAIAMVSNTDPDVRAFNLTINTPAYGTSAPSGFYNATYYFSYYVGVYGAPYGAYYLDNMTLSVLCLGNDSDTPLREIT